MNSFNASGRRVAALEPSYSGVSGSLRRKRMLKLHDSNLCLVKKDTEAQSRGFATSSDSVLVQLSDVGHDLGIAVSWDVPAVQECPVHTAKVRDLFQESPRTHTSTPPK